LQWTVTKNNCSNSASYTITNNSPSNTNIVAPVYYRVCDGKVTLTANKPTPFYATSHYWRQIIGTGMTSISTAFSIDVTGLSPGVNVFVWRVENNGCFYERNRTMYNDTVTSQAGLDDTVCTDYAYLSATDPAVIYPNQGVGYWTGYNGSIVDNTQPNTKVIDLPTGPSTFTCK